MANNRLYILDTETGEHIMVAKGFGSGWDWRKTDDELTRWLNEPTDSPLGLRNVAASDSGPTKLMLVTEDNLEAEIAKLNLKS